MRSQRSKKQPSPVSMSISAWDASPSWQFAMAFPRNLWQQRRPFCWVVTQTKVSRAIALLESSPLFRTHMPWHPQLLQIDDTQAVALEAHILRQCLSTSSRSHDLLAWCDLAVSSGTCESGRMESKSFGRHRPPAPATVWTPVKKKKKHPNQSPSGKAAPSQSKSLHGLFLGASRA